MAKQICHLNLPAPRDQKRRSFVLLPNQCHHHFAFVSYKNTSNLPQQPDFFWAKTYSTKGYARAFLKAKVYQYVAFIWAECHLQRIEIVWRCINGYSLCCSLLLILIICGFSKLILNAAIYLTKETCMPCQQAE